VIDTLKKALSESTCLNDEAKEEVGYLRGRVSSLERELREARDSLQRQQQQQQQQQFGMPGGSIQHPMLPPSPPRGVGPERGLAQGAAGGGGGGGVGAGVSEASGRIPTSQLV
jgi:hypothetical protein